MTDNLREAFLALYLNVEEIAVNSYETYTYPGSIFNDAIWRKNDDDFAVFREARTALGLKPFRHRTKEQFGGALNALREFRAPPAKQKPSR